MSVFDPIPDEEDCGSNYEDDGLIEPYEDEPRGDSIGCLFPGECVMPGEHFISECATPEMMDEVTNQ